MAHLSRAEKEDGAIIPSSKSNSDHSFSKWPRIDYHESMVPLGSTDTKGFSIHSQPLSNDLHGTTRKIGAGMET